MTALEKWSRPVERLMLAVLFAATLFAQWRTVAEHGVPVPFHDQWTAEIECILEPSTRGELRAADFWKPSNEHRPALTRLLAFAEFRLTGRWDTRLQMLVNGFFHACTALALALLARCVFSGAGRLVAIVGIGVFVGTSGSYENATWGYQSQFYLMVLLGVLYLGGTFTSSRIGPRWIAAQFAGALGLLAMAGGLLAPLAAAGIAIARLVRRRDRHGFATLGAALVLALLGWWMLPSTTGGGPGHATSATQFVDVWIKLLAWPSPLPLAAALMQLPWSIVALRTLASRDARAGDILLTALGGWVLLQAAAIAWSRGGSFSDIPPRYTDILAVGLAVNGVSVGLLLRGSIRRVAVVLVAAAWLVCGFAGWWHFSRPVRIDPIVAANHDLHRRTLEVVRDYIRTGDPAMLTRDGFVAHHFPSTATMRRLLDNPAIGESLPPEVRGEESTLPFAQSAALAIGSAKWIGLVSTILFTATLGFVLVLSVRATGFAAAPVANIPWFTAAVASAIAALALVVFGMRPWDTDSQRRIARALAAAGAPAAGFAIEGAAGGVYVTSDTPAALLHGTLRGGDAAFQGEQASTDFAISGRFVIVPVTGYPALPGNSLRLEMLATDGSVARKFAYNGTSPRERIAPWSVAVDAPAGARARLVLVDGTSGPGGWLGVGKPLLTDDADAARRLEVALAAASARNAPRFPGVLGGLAAYCAIAGLAARRTGGSPDLASAPSD